MSTITRHRLGRSAIFAASLVIGVGLGVGGSSLALWSDNASMSGSVASGHEYFAAGSPGDLTPAAEGTVSHTMEGEDLARTLIDDGEIAVPIQVDSLSQGNKGLRYHVVEPDWGDGLLGQVDMTIIWVDSVAACVPGAEPAALPDTVTDTDIGYTSTPVPALYSTTTEATSEFWCLRATLTALPDEGGYRNVATVSAADPNDIAVHDTDDWSAVVTTAFDPAHETDHEIVFTYETFRPGYTP